MLSQLVAGDPVASPLALRKQSRLERRRNAVSAGAILAVPKSDLPIVCAPAVERETLIDHLNRVTGGYLAAIPCVALIMVQGLRRVCHKNLIGGLRLPALGMVWGPGESRLKYVDPERIFQVFAPKVGWRFGTPRRTSRRSAP